MTDRIGSIEELRSIYKKPQSLAVEKEIDHLDPHAKAFIAISPFLVISSNNGNGQADASPRGEQAGFVKVIDDRTLILPDRPGNNRLDTLENIVKNPEVGLLFFVPGMNETLRINGKAEISTNPELLDMCIDKKLPKTVIKIEVEAVYMHCPKAFIRSKLWDPEGQIDRSSFPTLGKIIKDQLNMKTPSKLIDAAINLDAKTKLY